MAVVSGPEMYWQPGITLVIITKLVVIVKVMNLRLIIQVNIVVRAINT